MTAFKTLLFLLLVPGLLLGILPLWLISTEASLFSFGFLRWLAVPLWFAGWAAMLWCMWAFTVKGRGTPAPIDPPVELVISGLYRFVRNPMYVSGTLILLGCVFWSPSISILLCPLIFFTAAHLFIVFYEEPHLRKTFGAAYEDYCRSVPRWIPRFERN
jgi:protein-S-isoprenylcysteine O-methyltransferase Ste14